MDALTSQANVAGYKAAVVAADLYGGFFPMLMTAAGTVRPARLLVLGGGVAGLQAIGTAARLGAVVDAYDVRPEARNDVESVGARFVTLPTDLSANGRGGYARRLTADEAVAQQAALAAVVAEHDVVISTAAVPGGRPPLLVTSTAVAAMRPGSVVIDLASTAAGGNVEGSSEGATIVTDNGVTVVGAGNLPAQMPSAASTAYAHNVAALLEHLREDGRLALVPLEDPIRAGVVVTLGGQVVQPSVRELVGNPLIPTTSEGTDHEPESVH